ncbi:MAG: ATP-binding protein [Bacteroidales bacterium]
MNDLAMHILDIVQNSISANATWVEIAILINLMRDILTIRISDNGKGMPPEMVKRVTDPFVTSRTTRKVGLGLPLLKDSAEQSGGKLGIESTVGKGTVVEATFGLSNIDRPPLGNIANAYVMLVTMNPDINLALKYAVDENEYDICTNDLKEALGDDGITPDMFKPIEGLVQNSIDELSVDKLNK